MTHVRTKDATMHIDGPDDSGHYWLHLSASGETCRMDLGRPRGMIETALLMAASVKFGRPGGDYTLAPHLQKIVDGAKTAPQWDTQEDRLAPTDAAHVNETPKSEHDAGNVLTAAQAREAALREALDNKEQLDIWAQEILEGLCFADVLKIESYDDKIEAHSVIGRGIVEVLRALIDEAHT